MRPLTFVFASPRSLTASRGSMAWPGRGGGCNSAAAATTTARSLRAESPLPTFNKLLLLAHATVLVARPQATRVRLRGTQPPLA